MLRSAVLIAASAALTAITLVAIAGPLTPPAGPPVPTFKTLDEVEPRIPISGPTTITQPGSYYLTNDINITTSQSAITIQTDAVTLDLNGHTINGNNIGTNAITGISTGPRPIVIRNGRVSAFTGAGLNLSGTIYIEGVHASNCFEGFRLTGAINIVASHANTNLVDGFVLAATSGVAVLERCIADTNGGNGFFAATGATFRDCVANNNGLSGFRTQGAGVLHGCLAARNGIGFNLGEGSTANGCAADENNTNGFNTQQSASLAECVATRNGNSGFTTSAGTILNNCIARLNGGVGFVVGSGGLATNCAATANGADGFFLQSDARVTASIADGNGIAPGVTNGAGFRGTSDTVIDSVTATDNDIGIIGGFGGLVIRSTAAGNGTAFDFTNADHGPIVNLVVSSGPITSTSPLANIEY